MASTSSSGDGNLSTQPRGHCMWTRSERRTTVPTSWIKCLLTKRLSLLPCMEDLIADIEPVLQPHCKKRKSSVSLSFCHQQGGKGVGPELEGAPAQALQTTSGHPCPSGVLPSQQLAICCSPTPEDLLCFRSIMQTETWENIQAINFFSSANQGSKVRRLISPICPHGWQDKPPKPRWRPVHWPSTGGSSCKQRQKCCHLSATKSSVD